MSTHSKIIAELKSLSSSTLIGIYNDYCEKNQYDDFIKDIDSTEYKISHDEMSSMNDTLYIINGRGKVVTFSHVNDADSPFDYSDVATWIENNDLAEKYNIIID